MGLSQHNHNHTSLQKEISTIKMRSSQIFTSFLAVGLAAAATPSSFTPSVDADVGVVFTEDGGHLTLKSGALVNQNCKRKFSLTRITYSQRFHRDHQYPYLVPGGHHLHQGRVRPHHD